MSLTTPESTGAVSTCAAPDRERWHPVQSGNLFEVLGLAGYSSPSDLPTASAAVEKVIVPAGFAFSNFIVGVIVVAVLYLTREILVPIALAVLLSFVLAPLVRFLQGRRVPRSLAVIGAVFAALAIALSLASMVMVEVNQLANDLPRYQSTLSDKVHNLRDTVGRAGLLNASSMLKDLDRNLKDQEDGSAGSSLTGAPAGKKPIPVEVHQPDPGASETLVAMMQPLAAPVTTTAVVIIFLIFFLFQREDLRNRFIRLAGSEDLERTTAALDDAGQRLSKLFLTQLVLNAIFGAAIGLGLATIGVPSAPLWGLLATILRFVPYIGAILAAAFPIALAAAVGSDWSLAIWTIALFAVAEPLMGQVIEPLVWGRTAGLSPVAIVVAASFWTWLWGPLGLLLSTPLTLCLVVLARHVERLQFLDIMLGDQPALTPQQVAYQRMLTGDPIEAIEQARSFLKEGSVQDYYGDILLGALRLAEADATLGRLDDARLENIHQTVLEIIEDLASPRAANVVALGQAKSQAGNVANLDARKLGQCVFCIPGLGRLDDCAALIVADVLKREGIVARTTGAGTAMEGGDAETICVCFLEDVTEARTDFTRRKLSRQAPSAKVIVCLLGESRKEDSDDLGEDIAPRSLKAIVSAIEKVAAPSGQREQ
jgi:predicted PurR-regulated permease PerM